MRYYWKKLHRSKKSVLIYLSLTVIFFLYQVVRQYFSSYVASEKSDATPSVQISIPESETKPEEVVYLIEISTMPFEQLNFFATNDYNYPVFEQDEHHYEIVYDGKEISHLQLSPDQKRLGFYLHSAEEDTVFGKTSLVIMDIKKKSFKEISEGDLKVSNWEWKNNNEFIIYINCGTGCHLAHVRSVEDGKLIAEYLDKQDRE